MPPGAPIPASVVAMPLIVVLLLVLLGPAVDGQQQQQQHQQQQQQHQQQQQQQQQPVLVSATLGSNVSLPCDFSTELFSGSADHLRVIWMRDSVTLTFNWNSLLDPRFSVPQPGEASGHSSSFHLQISGVGLADQGLYSCVASYGGGYSVRKADLVVKVPPRILSAASSQSKVVVAEGQSLTLRCEAEGNPPPVIAWFRRVNVRSLSNEGNQRLDALGSGPVYSVANVSRQCDGVFQCRADNGVEPADTREMRVIVHYRPRVSVANEQISQSRGQSTMVMCSVSGLPAPELYWEHRGRRYRPGPEAATCWNAGRHCLYLQSADVPETHEVIVVEGSQQQMMLTRMDLMVRNLTAGDFGVYECVARSELGEDRKAAHVLELQDPRRGPVQATRDVAVAAPSLDYGPAPDASSGSSAISAAASSSGRGANAEAIDAAASRINKHSSGSLVTSSAASVLPTARSVYSLFALAAAAAAASTWLAN